MLRSPACRSCSLRVASSMATAVLPRVSWIAGGCDSIVSWIGSSQESCFLGLVLASDSFPVFGPFEVFEADEDPFLFGRVMVAVVLFRLVMIILMCA